MRVGLALAALGLTASGAQLACSGSEVSGALTSSDGDTSDDAEPT